MGIFESNDSKIIEDAKETQKGMQNRIEKADPDELKGMYNDSVTLENVYGSFLSTIEPGNEYYSIVKGIYESQSSITKQIKARAETDEINLFCD